MQDFEQQTFQKLAEAAKTKKKQSKEGKKQMKRPAAAMSSNRQSSPDQGAGCNQAAKGGTRAKEATEIQYGCIRCRGNIKGCSSCWDPNFGGLRLHGRQAWREYIEPGQRFAAFVPNHAALHPHGCDSSSQLPRGMPGLPGPGHAFGPGATTRASLLAAAENAIQSFQEADFGPI